LPTAEIKEVISASAAEVFELLHDYRRRLEWDTLLQKAYLEDDFPEARKGAISVCQGRAILGGFALRTEYVSFEKARWRRLNCSTSRPFSTLSPPASVTATRATTARKSFIK
jgi:hypothetical protein